MCDTQVNMSPPTSAPTSAVIRPSSSVVVSQPVPQSGLSPDKERYLPHPANLLVHMQV